MTRRVAHPRGRTWRTSCLPIAVVVILALVGDASAQRSIAVEPKPGATAITAYGDSWALIVGINDYQHPKIPKLRAALNDARAVERALLAQGFRRDRIITLVDRQATKAAIERVLGDQLRTQIGEDDRLLVFFAGHGKTVRVKNEDEGYLLPADADPSQLYSTTISMEALARLSRRLPAKHVLYVIDACYSGYAIYKPRSISDDLLEEMVRKPAIQIMTAGREGDEAQERRDHGVFTDVFLRGIQGGAFTPGKTWLATDELYTWVRERVYAEAAKLQLPQFGNLHGEGQFVFVRSGAKVAAVAAPPVSPPRPPAPKVTEEVRVGSLGFTSKQAGVEIWIGDRKLGETRAGRTLVVADLAEGRHRVVGKKAGHRDWEREIDVAGNQRTEVVVDIEPLGPAKLLRTEDGAEMVLVPAGEFTMGSNDGDGDEKPPHRVHLDAFYIDRHEVTNALYRRFMDATGRPAPAYWNDARLNEPRQPVVGVSWDDAGAYCQWAGKRLPTEAEWEKAARGTDARKYPWGEPWDASRANSRETNLGSKTAPVGAYPGGASPYGAHDMAGNAWEWVADWYGKDYYQRGPDRNPTGPDSGTSRVLRGGSWYGRPVSLRTSNRNTHAPGIRDDDIGFRCARGSKAVES